MRRGARVLVACSGGPDSVVLADVLVDLAKTLALTVEVASVDHGLRPESSDEVRSVAALSAAWGVPFHPLRLTLQPGPGVQARAREARYAALQALRRDRQADVVAVGHTRDDQAETVLARVLRGSSVRGLRGIWPARHDAVVRPLIDCTREDVHAYLAARRADPSDARSNGLVAVSDPSNDDRAYERVRLRRDTLPALLAEDADVVRHLAELADDARDLVALGEHVGAALLAVALANTPAGSRVVAVAPLRAALPAARREALRQLVESADPSRTSPRRAPLLELERAVLGPPGAHVLLGGGLAYRRVGDRLDELRGASGRDNDSGGLRPGSEETTKLYV